MKFSSSPIQGRRGYMLVECLIYIAVLAIVMGLAFGAFYRSLDNARDLNRTAEQILHVLAAGEQWRADIRHAQAPPRIETSGAVTVCEIRTGPGKVVYLFGEGPVWRKEGEQEAKLLLPRVNYSAMVQDQARKVSAWRWELELATRKKHVHLRPLFTFEAVLPAAVP